MLCFLSMFLPMWLALAWIGLSVLIKLVEQIRNNVKNIFTYSPNLNTFTFTVWIHIPRKNPPFCHQWLDCNFVPTSYIKVRLFCKSYSICCAQIFFVNISCICVHLWWTQKYLTNFLQATITCDCLPFLFVPFLNILPWPITVILRHTQTDDSVGATFVWLLWAHLWDQMPQLRGSKSSLICLPPPPSCCIKWPFYIPWPMLCPVICVTSFVCW